MSSNSKSHRVKVDNLAIFFVKEGRRGATLEYAPVIIIDVISTMPSYPRVDSNVSFITEEDKVASEHTLSDNLLSVSTLICCSLCSMKYISDTALLRVGQTPTWCAAVLDTSPQGLLRLWTLIWVLEASSKASQTKLPISARSSKT